MSQVSQAEELDFLEQHRRDAMFETNFAVKKFLELPVKEQEVLFSKINSEPGEKTAEAAKALLDLILKNLSEMGKFVHEGIDSWIIWPRDMEPKAIYLLLYFKHNLQKNPDGTFAINPIG